MIKLEKNILNSESFFYYHNFYKFMQVHENEYYQCVSLVKEPWRVLYLIHTRDTRNKKYQEITKFPPVIIKFKT